MEAGISLLEVTTVARTRPLGEVCRVAWKLKFGRGRGVLRRGDIGHFETDYESRKILNSLHFL